VIEEQRNRVYFVSIVAFASATESLIPLFSDGHPWMEVLMVLIGLLGCPGRKANRTAVSSKILKFRQHGSDMHHPSGCRIIMRIVRRSNMPNTWERIAILGGLCGKGCMIITALTQYRRFLEAGTVYSKVPYDSEDGGRCR